MNKNRKEQILVLREQGKTLRQIKTQLGCAQSTVVYHLYPKVKRRAIARAKAAVKEAIKSGKYKEYRANRKLKVTAKSRLSSKISQFHRLGNRKKKKRIMVSRLFTTDELFAQIGGHPTCYLTGQDIDLRKPNSYALDHKIPVSQHGSNELCNVGLCTIEANAAKSAKTPDEFVQLCVKVVEYNGYTVTPAA